MTVVPFSRTMNFNKKKPTNFVQKIPRRIKIHTFRQSSRIKEGDLLHLWDMNPRTKGKVKPDPKPIDISPLLELEGIFQFGEDPKGRKCLICQSIQRCLMCVDPDNFMIKIDGTDYSDEHLIEYVATNDGFDSAEDFKKWFSHKHFDEKDPKKTVLYRIIHWTNKRYG
jgi:hypothetical protein